MELSISGKKAIITGGSKGIGKAIARELAKEGVNLGLCARNESDLIETADEITSNYDVKVFTATADTRDDSSISMFIDNAASALGGLDILINNAAAPGGLVMGPLDQADPLDLLDDIDTKVVGYLRSTKKSVPYMKKAQWGRIINIGGLAARSGGAISGMRNLALVHLTKTLSNELGQFGITANIIHPGATRTERTQPMQANIAHTQGLSVEDIERKATQFIDIKRMVEAEEIAYLALFLCSPRASAITGESIAAGGGVGSAVFS
jgi:NAD(P)-dependent dehydrogenase (short-subunit alcohol dehydrogenase family)